MELLTILILIGIPFLVYASHKDKKEKRERESSARLKLSAWMAEAGIDLECTKCLSRDFVILQYLSHGLSFQAQCTGCGAKKWFKAMRTSEPFDFSTCGFSEEDALIPQPAPPVNGFQEETEQTTKGWPERGKRWAWPRDRERWAREEREEQERKREEQERKRLEFSTWMADAGIDLECTKCLSSDFIMLQYSPHGLSFEGRCATCESKKWFKAMRTGEPFDFSACEFFLDSIIPKPVQPVDGFQEETGQAERSRRISESVRHEVWRRDQGRCCECGSKENIEFDHIIPFSKGGSNTARNIQLLCESCNAKKRDRI